MMRAEVKDKIDIINQGNLPEGYVLKRALLFPKQWKLAPLSSVLSENKKRNDEGIYDKDQVLSVSGESGVVNQIEFMGRSYAGESVLNYHIVYPGNLVYTKSPLKESPYGIIKINKGDAGIVSTLYAVYHCKQAITGLYLDYYFSMDLYLNNYLKPLVKRGAKNDMKVNNEDVLRGEIALPSLPEQQKIVEILTQCDKVIDLKKQLVEEKHRRKKWLMQKLLDPESGVRLPGFEWSEWKTKLLTECFSYIRNGFVGTATPFYCDDGVTYIEGMNIKDGRWNLSELEHISVDFSKTHPHSILKENDVVVVQSGHTGDCTVVPKELDGCNSHAIIIMTPLDNIDSHYCAYYINSEFGKKALMGSTTGNIVQHILASDMKKFKLPMPCKKEQTAIANVLVVADQEIDLLEQELAAWQTKKKSLMQLLLTGLVRVRV